MRFDKKELLLYAVTDRNWLGEETLAGQVEKAVKGGATFVQLREKVFLRRRERSGSFAGSIMCPLW